MNFSKTVMRCSCLALLIFLFDAGVKQGFAQTNWHKYAGNPVLEKGEPGTWDDQIIQGLSVLFDGATYHMWYHGSNAKGNDAIGYATSLDGTTWEKYEGNPVIKTGGPGSFDELDLQMGHVIFEENVYKMWYDGHSNSTGWAIGLASSPDGIHWTKDTLNNPVLTTGAPGSWDDRAVWGAHIIHEDTTYKMWYSGIENRLDIGFLFRRIGYSESPDGINWTKHPKQVLEQGDYITWGYDLETPMVIFDGVNYNMWYSIINTAFACCYQVDYAVSPDGIHWTKDSLNNPALESGESGSWHTSIWHPYVIENDNLFRMWFSGSGGFGYAEDFSQLVHADSVIIKDKFVDPDVGPLHVLGHVINPEGRELSAKAFLLSDDESVLDSTDLFDDGLNDDGDAGNGVYGGNWAASGEKNYTVGIKTVDLETGFTRNGLNWFITDRFTTKGPVIVESYEIISPDTVPNHGDRLSYRLTLKNGGQTATATNVTTNLKSLDSCATISGFPDRPYGDIAPGTTALHSGSHSIIFSDTLIGCSNPMTTQILVEISSDGQVFWYDTLDIVVAEIEDYKIKLPKTFALHQNYPNPFNPKTKIKFALPKPENIIINVYNTLGQRVETLLNRRLQAGNHEVEFNAENLSSGVYLYRIEAGEFQDVKKMILLR